MLLKQLSNMKRNCFSKGVSINLNSEGEGASKSFFKGGAASKGMEEFLEAGVGTFKETMVLSSIQQFKNILSATF